MAQYKSGDPGVPPFVVENGSQTVVIPGVDARTDIPFSADRPPYFREQETGPTYEVASAPQYTGGDTVVTLTGEWQGDSGEIDGLFHVDFSANMGYPLFYSGDIDIPDILRRWVVGLDGDMHDLIVGATVEQGTNANGSYWRWESGLQVCTHTLTLQDALGNNILAGVWVYPAGFTVFPYVDHSLRQGLTADATPPLRQRFGRATAALGLASVSLRAFATGDVDWAAGDVMTTDAFAIGRWK